MISSSGSEVMLDFVLGDSNFALGDSNVVLGDSNFALGDSNFVLGESNFVLTGGGGEDAIRNLESISSRGLGFFLQVTSASRSEVRISGQFLPRGPKSEVGREVLSDFFPGPK